MQTHFEIIQSNRVTQDSNSLCFYFRGGCHDSDGDVSNVFMKFFLLQKILVDIVLSFVSENHVQYYIYEKIRSRKLLHIYISPKSKLTLNIKQLVLCP